MDITNYIMPELLLIVPVLWVVGATNHFSVTVVFTAVTQGILCAGAAVYGNQIFKQLRKKENGSKEKKDGD